MIAGLPLMVKPSQAAFAEVGDSLREAAGSLVLAGLAALVFFQLRRSGMPDWRRPRDRRFRHACGRRRD
ncbi:MAG: hypothetical protein AB7G13_04080 [Lautropia sp.]